MSKAVALVDSGKAGEDHVLTFSLLNSCELVDKLRVNFTLILMPGPMISRAFAGQEDC